MKNEHSSPAHDDNIIRNLMFCAHFLRRNTEPKGSQRRVLFILQTRGPMTQKALLDEMGVRASSMSELVGKLLSKGYITKEKGEADKRIYNISITEAGRTALVEMQQAHRENMTELLSDLDEADRVQLAGLLAKLQEHWSKREAALPPCECHQHR